jgi:hypothetical protein
VYQCNDTGSRTRPPLVPDLDPLPFLPDPGSYVWEGWIVKTPFSIHGHKWTKVGTGTGTESFIKPSGIYIRILTLLIRLNYLTWSQMNEVHLDPCWYTILRITPNCGIMVLDQRYGSEGFVSDLDPDIFIPDPGSYTWEGWIVKNFLHISYGLRAKALKS